MYKKVTRVVTAAEQFTQTSQQLQVMLQYCVILFNQSACVTYSNIYLEIVFLNAILSPVEST